MGVSCGGGDITWNLKVDTSDVARNFMGLNSLLTQYISLAREAGLEGGAIQAIAKLEQLRIAIQSAIRSLQMFYQAVNALGMGVTLGTVFGFGLGVGGLLMSGAMLASSVSRGY